MPESTFHVHIPKPCHENWQHMTPAEKGRFCGQCQKTVVDFTTMTDDEVLDTLQAATGNTCGRFLAQQLDRPLQPTHLQRSWLRVKWFWAALISGALFANKATAQKASYADTVVVTAPKSKAEVVTMGKVMMPAPQPIIIQGQVTDESGIPMAGVSVMIEGSTVGTSTNALGRYELRVKEPAPSVNIQYSSVGYMSMQHQLQLAPLKSYHIYQQHAQFTRERVALSGEVVIVRKKKKSKPAASMKPTVEKTTTKELLQVFPNPAKAGQPIFITQVKAGTYSLQLYSNDGRPVATACILQTKGSANLSWTLPAPLSAGLYTLLLTNEKQQPQMVQLLVQ
ncbi:MAG: carboxypeptidase-like regulatory domain-containing protein [Chitinophagaceae bacterium]|nr:carboxypeptidase-like regulatory domain-containing protein [Chitinophagaceae bacterium]